MLLHLQKKVAVLLLILIIVLGGIVFLFSDQSVYDYSFQQEKANESGLSSVVNLALSVDQSQSTDPINAFPGQLVSMSYYLGASSPSASYYEVTVTLNYSSYRTLNVVPLLMSSLNLSGYYLLFSFEMPNDQPGTWWNVGFQIIPIETSTIQTEVTANLLAQGTQVWMEYPTLSAGYNYMISGGANFSSSTNVTGIQVYPANPPGSTIGSAQVNYWTFTAGMLKVNFSLYESVQGSGKTTPPFISAVVTYNISYSAVVSGSPISEMGPRIDLIQGNGAYLMGITSGQIAQITNAMNQSLSIPISQLNAAVVSINGDTASINTNFGTMIVSLNDINATVYSIKDGQATVTSDLGTIITSLSSLNATISSINLGIIEINTSLGEITTSIDSINASLTSINGTTATIQTGIGTIITSLNSINATISSIHQGMATVNTTLGQVKTSLKSLNSSIIALSGDTASIMTSAGEINASLNSLNTSIFSSSLGLPWFNSTYANIETCLGNISGTITGVSNDTATIETSLGVVSTSVNSIKTDRGSAPISGDPITLFDLIIISMLAALLIVASLAMLSSRNTLKIMGEKGR